MIVFPFSGTAGLFLKYTSGSTAASMSGFVLKPPTDKYVYYTSGAATLVQGVKLTGQTSSATMIVEAVVLCSGTLGGTGTGIVFLRDISGTITAGENLRTATPATACVAKTTQLSVVPDVPPKSVFLQCETYNLRILWTGDSPTNSAATPASQGLLFQANENIEITGWANVVNLQWCNAVSASNGVLNMIVNY